jgi:hypothetical protein
VANKDDAVKWFDPKTGKWNDAPPEGADPALYNDDMHHAIIEGGKLPTDRTEEELRGEPAITAAPPVQKPAGSTGSTGVTGPKG